VRSDFLIVDCSPPWCDSSIKRSNSGRDLEYEVGGLKSQKTGLGQGLQIFKPEILNLRSKINMNLKSGGVLTPCP